MRRSVARCSVVGMYCYTETKKAELFAKVRSGQVRILLGSTPKLGAGTNIQDRLIALHHLDCPWKPSDLEQQEGRILRQGNRNQKVKIFRYVTENTFDSYMWQILENKQKFISQIMTSKSPVRACDDVDDTALTYAEIKALATGNPYIKEKMDLDIQVSKLKLMRANHTSQIYSLESDIARRYPAEITAAKERIAGLKADLAVAKPLLEQDKEKFSITVEDRVYTDRKEAGSAILAACAAMKIAKTEGQIADLGGFAISSRFDAFAQTFKLTIKRQSSYAKRKNLLMGSNPIIAPDSEMLWNAAIVWRILRRYEYTGALVMGRRKKIDVNTTSVRTLPEDKWIIAENAHEAIVTKDEYYQAQKAIRNVTPIQYKVDDDFALKGKICCGNCNRQLRHERQYGEMVFYCGYKRSAGKFSKCYGGYYREYSVNAKVARAIKTVFYALDVVNQGMQEKQSITVRCVDIEDLEKQAEAIRVEQIKLYESYADGVLRRDVYIEKKKILSEKLVALQDSIRTEKEEQECADELDEEIRALTKQASEKTYIGGLTKECVDAFVSMVYLYDDQTMKIEFNCEDVIRRALEKYGT